MMWSHLSNVSVVTEAPSMAVVMAEASTETDNRRHGHHAHKWGVRPQWQQDGDVCKEIYQHKPGRTGFENMDGTTVNRKDGNRTGVVGKNRSGTKLVRTNWTKASFAALIREAFFRRWVAS